MREEPILLALARNGVEEVHLPRSLFEVGRLIVCQTEECERVRVLSHEHRGSSFALARHSLLRPRA